ncbi:MAG: ECF transporter S component [Clostridia bacterium]|nr:ECF transporter S component [Clostridia bacterium]
MRKITTQKLVVTAMFFAIGLVLPFVTGQVPQIGRMLLPMHLPVFLCSLIVGWPYGLVIGFLLPLVRSLLFVMPALFPTALEMMFELAAYGFFAGYIYQKLLAAKVGKTSALFIALIASMILGRVVFLIARIIIFKLSGSAFDFNVFLADAVLNAIPGIIMQIVLIPTMMLSMERNKINTEPTQKNY